MDHLSWFSMQIHCVIFVNFSPFCYCCRRWCCCCCCWCWCSIQFDFHRRNIYLFLLFGLFIDRKSLILTYVYVHIVCVYAYVRTSYTVQWCATSILCGYHEMDGCIIVYIYTTFWIYLLFGDCVFNNPFARFSRENTLSISDALRKRASQ